jgi:hypothetical protein
MAKTKIPAPRRNRAGHVYVSVLEVPGAPPATRWQACTVPAATTPGGPHLGPTPRAALGELMEALGESTWLPHGQRTSVVLRSPWKAPGEDPGGRPARATDGAAKGALNVRLSPVERQRVRGYALAQGVSEAAVVRQALSAMGVLT